MAFWSKSEIDKTLSKYGQTKGTLFLTYLNTYTTKALSLMKENEKAADQFASTLVNYILEKHGLTFLNEYTAFFNSNIKNAILLAELVKSGTKYINNDISTKEPVETSVASPQSIQRTVQSEPVAKPVPKYNPAKPKNPLGRDENKHISCKYEGHENDCPDDCSKCAISIKTDGDIALASNKPDEAIRQYKKAVFVSPKFAEAWVNLGNVYGMKSEYNNALGAFDKAIAIDGKYGKALFSKAITLRNLGKLDEAMELANRILDLYDDANVKQFKANLVSAGVKDRSSIVDAGKAKDALSGKAGEVMRNNNLLNSEGTAEVISEIYKPEEFTKKVLNYCKRKYASLGESKVRGECVITSFYGSICAVLLYQRNPSDVINKDVFDYLNNNIDVEFTDVNAERLLGTKAREEKAESIWELFSPYLSLSQAVFNTDDELTDDILLEAMKHAYVLGMLVAKYYTSDHTKKHQLGTRLEINQALERLAASSKDYQDPPPESAMCYSIRVPSEVNIPIRCSKCGRASTMRVYQGEENLIERYRKLALQFCELGHNADVLCLCDECAERYLPTRSSFRKHNIVFSFTAKGATKPVYSYPSTWRYSDFEYKVAISFLKGTTSIKELSADTDSSLAADTYLQHVRNVIGDGK